MVRDKKLITEGFNWAGTIPTCIKGQMRFRLNLYNSGVPITTQSDSHAVNRW